MECGVIIFGIECLFLAFVQVFCSKATFIIMGQKANVNNKVVVLFTTILQGWNGVMSTKNIKKSGKILHKIIGKNRAPRT